MTTNDLIALMTEFGVEVRMLGTDEEPSPTGIALAGMLLEIHEHRTRISAERQPVIPDEWRPYSMHEVDTGEVVVMLQHRNLALCRMVYGKAATWHEALSAAVAAAEGSGE